MGEGPATWRGRKPEKEEAELEEAAAEEEDCCVEGG